jgi:undecaprenyl diphosphate synthase
MKPIEHIAIIMDGNGRWGMKNKGNRNAGHSQGLKTIEKIINQVLKKRIRYLTLFTFSTENWKRPKSEINFLFRLLNNFLKKKINELNKKDLKLKFIGSISKLDKNLAERILKTEKITQYNKGTQVNIALNYGSKDEITRSFKLIKKKKLKISKVNIEANFYTKNIPDPDILIRTGNRNRLSNFMLWQLAYTEIFFVKKFWPDFTLLDFNKIVKQYQNIIRNYGAIN